MPGFRGLLQRQVPGYAGTGSRRLTLFEHVTTPPGRPAHRILLALLMFCRVLRSASPLHDERLEHSSASPWHTALVAAWKLRADDYTERPESSRACRADYAGSDPASLSMSDSDLSGALPCPVTDDHVGRLSNVASTASCTSGFLFVADDLRRTQVEQTS